MNGCQSKTGIFTLKICGETAAASCAECGKPVCFKHYRLHQGSPYCVECYVARGSGADGADADSPDVELEKARRRQEMDSTAAQAHYGGFEMADYEAFDTTADGAIPDDDAIPPDSFQDS